MTRGHEQESAGATMAPRSATRRGGMPWADARVLAHRVADPLPAEEVRLRSAAGRTLAAPVVAAVALPTCDNAAMDGYAVRGPAPWRVIHRMLAGQPAPPALNDCEAVEIATGAPVPAGTERVLPYEACRRAGDLVEAEDEPRDHIRRTGEYVRAGQEVLAAGGVLSAAALGLAAGVGADTVVVRRRPTVRVLVTGDEVVVSGVPGPGQVRDAIGPTLATLLPAWGAEVGPVRAVGDTAPALTRAIVMASSTVDIIVVGGSSSVGPADHLRRVVDTLGARLYVDGVACKPGHPQLLARIGGAWVVGLPGNPYAALVAACTLVQPLLAGLTGQELPDLPRAALAGDPRVDDHDTRLVPVRWEGERVRVVNGSRPGHLGPAAHADAIAVVPPGARPGATLELLRLPGAA